MPVECAGTKIIGKNGKLCVLKSLPEDVKEELMKFFLTLKLPGGKENKGKVIFPGEYTE